MSHVFRNLKPSHLHFHTRYSKQRYRRFDVRVHIPLVIFAPELPEHERLLRLKLECRRPDHIYTKVLAEETLGEHGIIIKSEKYDEQARQLMHINDASLEGDASYRYCGCGHCFVCPPRHRLSCNRSLLCSRPAVTVEPRQHTPSPCHPKDYFGICWSIQAGECCS